MRKLLLIGGLFISINGFTQNITKSTAAGPGEVKDQKNVFYCGVGEAPMILSKADRQFEKQFQVEYVIVGCILFLSIEEMSAHNKSVAELLDRKPGTEWRKKLRSDVIGVGK
jgi:hypothetical protein